MGKGDLRCRGGRLCPPDAESTAGVCKTMTKKTASMVVGRGDLTPPPKNETFSVYRRNTEHRENAGLPAGGQSRPPLRRNAVVYRNHSITYLFRLPCGGVRSPRPTNGEREFSAFFVGVDAHIDPPAVKRRAISPPRSGEGLKRKRKNIFLFFSRRRRRRDYLSPPRSGGGI